MCARFMNLICNTKIYLYIMIEGRHERVSLYVFKID